MLVSQNDLDSHNFPPPGASASTRPTVQAPDASLLDLWEEPLRSNIMPHLGCRSLVSLARSCRLLADALRTPSGRELLTKNRGPEVTLRQRGDGKLRFLGVVDSIGIEDCSAALFLVLTATTTRRGLAANSRKQPTALVLFDVLIFS